MPLKLSIITKLSGLVAASVVLTAVAINEIYVHGTQHLLVERVTADLEQKTDFFRYPLEEKINHVREDIQLLGQLKSTRGALRDPQHALTSSAIHELADMMTQMLNTTAYYRHIALISTADGGRELMHIERDGDAIVRVDSPVLEAHMLHELQEVEDSASEEVRLSPLHLLSHGGVIAQPHTLVMHVAMPLYSAQQELLGIVAIEADFGQVLHNIARQAEDNDAFYVTNEAGDYLEHPDDAKLYSGELGEHWRIQRDYPDIAPIMRNAQENAVTLLPEDLENGHVLAFKKYHYDAAHPERYLGIAVEAPYKATVDSVAQLEKKGFLFSVGITVATVLLGILLLRVLIRPLGRIAAMVVRYRKGEKNIDLPVTSPDEIGVLAREFDAMMQQKNGEDWVRETLVRTTESLLGHKNLHRFAQAVMDAVTPAIGAQIGVMYISGSYAHEKSVPEVEGLRFLAAYGYPSYGRFPKVFGMGDGLVGQCASSRLVMLVEDVPSDYLHITSALGEAPPRTLLLLPVLFENNLAAVMEFATLGEFTELQRSLLQQLCFNIGVIINAISASQRTEELLEETRMAAEELQRNEEELKTQQEELQAANEEMEEKNKALEEQNAQIREQARALEESTRAVEEKAEELERANSYKSEFLANMSHELRTPLNSLLILAGLLANNEEGNLTAEQVEEARIIEQGGQELLKLINDILDLSKVEAGKILLTPEEVSLEDMAARLQQQFAPVARQGAVAFHVTRATDAPPTLFTDGQRVEQILKNLLSNAFKFTQAGSVTLEIKRVGERVAFAVVDTGIGIDTAKLQDIFEAFQQEDGSTCRHYGGTGLGLTIARKFAQLLGGEIKVSSEKGVGSSFTLMLPLQPNTALRNAALESHMAMPEIIELPMVQGDNRLLLVIEDDHQFAAALMKIARKRGYECIEAGDGKTGLAMAMQHPVTAIVLDLKLPDGDGLHVLQQLKSNEAMRHIPVHIITGADETSRAAPMKSGAVGYLTKPLAQADIESLFARIETVRQAKVKRLLVVEDDSSTQSAIRSLLRDSDIAITSAATGAQALALAAEKPFDCMILDLALPDMTGLEWLERWEKTQGNCPPVIIYTARDLNEEEHRRLNAYTNSIVIKGAHSAERLLDEVTLFLHRVESKLPARGEGVRMVHDTDHALQGHRVLLVDDDLRNTFALSKLLKKQGLQVVIADNGELALEKLRSDRAIELVIMDIMMPVMDGYQAIAAMRADARFATLPVIALTARAMPQEQERCMAAGANDYLTKPVDVAQLLALLRLWLFKQEHAA